MRPFVRSLKVEIVYDERVIIIFRLNGADVASSRASSKNGRRSGWLDLRKLRHCWAVMYRRKARNRCRTTGAGVVSSRTWLAAVSGWLRDLRRIASLL